MEHDELDFAAWVDARRSALWRSAWLLTGDHHRADDLVQTALLKVWPRWPRVCSAGDPEPYVRRVMYTTYLSWWHRRWNAELPTADLPETAATPTTEQVDLAAAAAVLSIAVVTGGLALGPEDVTPGPGQSPTSNQTRTTAEPALRRARRQRRVRVVLAGGHPARRPRRPAGQAAQLARAVRCTPGLHPATDALVRPRAALSRRMGADPLTPGAPVAASACRYLLEPPAPGTITQSSDGTLQQSVTVDNESSASLVRLVADGSRSDPCGGVAYDLERRQDVVLVRDSDGDVHAVSTAPCWANDLTGSRRYPSEALATAVNDLLD